LILFSNLKLKSLLRTLNTDIALMWNMAAPVA